MSDAICPMCEHPVAQGDISPTTLWVDGKARDTHRSCMLRETIGGIGHLIAHDYWCSQYGDPDAGLSRRQSALLVDAYVALVGIDRREPQQC